MNGKPTEPGPESAGIATGQNLPGMGLSSRRSPNSRPPIWKKTLFRFLAVFLGLAPLLAAELILRGLNLGRPTDSDDPFVGFSEIHPLFVLDEETGLYEIPKSRQKHFCPESFAATKPANEFRIFVLGGSTVQGRPYAIETSFTTWLELSLKVADPSRRWEVVNCGGVSYASYRLIPILQEVLDYQPDMIIVCEGHNEFLEDRTYGHIKSAPVAFSWVQHQVSRLRTYNFLREGVLRYTPRPIEEEVHQRPMLGPESDAMLDWKGGMENYHRDPDWQRGVITHFEFALRRMAAIADRAGIPLLLIVPPSNLEWPPYKCQHRDGMTEGEQQKFVELLEQARGLYGKDLNAALALLQQARQLDDLHARVHFEIGKCFQGLGKLDEAKQSLSRARDLDVCPLRMLESMKPLMHRAAMETGTPLIDAEALISDRSPGGIPGNRWLVDHVHPNLEGHQLIAEAVVEELVRQKRLNPMPEWQTMRDAAYLKHLEDLGRSDPAYFPRGALRLRSEQGWAHGLTKREKTKVKAPADSP